MRVRFGRGLIKAFVCGLAVLAFFLFLLLMVHVWEQKDREAKGSAVNSGDAADESGEELMYYNGAWYVQKRKLETVLILGIDKYTGEQEQPVQGSFEQADFMMLLALDRENGTSTGIHLNRDTMTEFNILSGSGASAGTKTGQLALSHTYGDTAQIRCKNTVDAVSNLLYGVKIDHYLSLTMDSVAVLNDLAGGVTLEVLDEFPGDGTLVKGETMTLRGQQALTYVRTRKGLEDSSNLHRMERQRQYLEALQTQLFEKIDADSEFLISSLLQINPYMVSDCTIEQLSDLVEAIKSCEKREYVTLEGKAEKGEVHVEFYVDEEALQRLVMEMFYEKVEEAK